MTEVISAVRLKGRIGKDRRLALEGILPFAEDTEVEVLVLPLAYTGDDISEEEWLKGLASNKSFDFLNDPREDLYSFDDGVPYDG